MPVSLTSQSKYQVCSTVHRFVYYVCFLSLLLAFWVLSISESISTLTESLTESFVAANTSTTTSISTKAAAIVENKNELPIVDAIMYNGEPIILTRIELLYDVVDRFYITESTFTFSGNPKPLFSKQYLDNFAPYQDKITWLVYKPSKNITNAWTGENQQREFALTQIRSDVENNILSTPFVVVNTDGDELVNPKILKDMQPGGPLHSQVVNQEMFLQMDWFCYNANWKKNGIWDAGHILPGEKLLTGEYSLQTLRNRGKNDRKPYIPEAGWHFTYFLSIDDIITKIQSFAHQEVNKPRFKNRERISNCIRDGTDLFGRKYWAEQMTPYNTTSLPIPLQRFHQDVVARQNITQ